MDKGTVHLVVSTCITKDVVKTHAHCFILCC